MITLVTLTANSQDIVALEKGEVAPFSGALVPPEKLNEMRKVDEELVITRKQITSFKELNAVNEEKIDFYRVTASDYRDELRSERTKNVFKNAGYFLLGALLTGVATKVAIEASK
jgi:hypothetical protein